MADGVVPASVDRHRSGARSAYVAPLEVLPAVSHASPSQFLSWLVPPTRPSREAALVEFMARLASRYAGPILLFDRAHIEQVFVALAHIQARQRCRFLAPVKSFPHPVFLQLAARHLAGFDVSNAEEYLCLPDDLRGRLVALAGPVLRAEQLSRLRDRGNDLIVYVDSLHQLGQLESFESPLEYGVRLDSAGLLRGRRSASDALAGGLRHSRFGMSPDELRAVRSGLARSRHRFVGVLVHHGSEQNTAETYLALIEEMLAHARRLGLRLESLNLGGGEHHLDIASLANLVGTIRDALDEDVDLALEPGRLLTQGAAYAIGRIENWRPRNGAVEYVVDVSMDCHLRWSRPTLIVPRPSSPGRPMRARFYGPTCHEDDCLGEHLVWADDAGEPPFRPGELVLFGNVSGYSASIRTSFNGVAPPSVHFLDERIGA